MATTPVPPPLEEAPTDLPVLDEIQTVQIELPPDILEKLTPADPGWFTQPVATILAACIAVIAALVALGGVWWQVAENDRRSRRSMVANSAALRKQLKAQEALAVASRADEWRRMQRNERYELAQRVLEATEELYLLVREADHEAGSSPAPVGNSAVRSEHQLEYMRISKEARLAALQCGVAGAPEVGGALLRYAGKVRNLVFLIDEPLPFDDYSTLRHQIFELVEAAIRRL